MDIWVARTTALQHLEYKRADQVEVLSKAFGLIDSTIEAYEMFAGDNTYARVCGLTLVKIKNLAVGSYSLVLDGLGQEAGALLRPFIEYVELLSYFRSFPEMVERALKDDLPKAGERARAIDGKFHQLRSYLNSHASHSSYSAYSLSHLIDPRTSRFRKLQVTSPAVLDRNVRDFAVQLCLACNEAVLGLTHLEVPDLEPLAGEADEIRSQLIRVFDLQSEKGSAV